MESSISNKIKTRARARARARAEYDWDVLFKDVEFVYIGNHHLFSRVLSAYYIWSTSFGINVSAYREDLKFLEFAPHKVKKSLMQYLESRMKFPYDDTNTFLKKAGVIQDA